jgi:hypothetical protein
MEEIKRIVSRCIDKLNKDNKFRITLYDDDKLTQKEIRSMYYTIYLTSEGVRNGTYLEIRCDNLSIFNGEKEYVEYLEETFKELKEIKNIDFYIGKLYDGSLFRDTLYVYYKPRKTKLFKIINFIEAFDRNNTNNNKLQSNIAKLLSYEIVNYNKTEDFILIHFRLENDGFEIDGYYITKNQLQKAYDKMIKINKALRKIKEYCELVITDFVY